MGTGIGAASDFYRVRLMHLDGVDSPAFEWREDILYRSPKTEAPAEYEVFQVEAVALGNEEDVTSLGLFESAGDAHEALGMAAADLTGLTRAEFEERYFPAEA
ncbi:MAG TPA: hypothetical protein VIL17_00780 [Coriobacteriia bacterium]